MTSILDTQRRLIALGYALPKFGADGKPGAETAAALCAFQRDRGLPETGMADAPTLDALMTQDVAVSQVIVPASWMPAAKMQRIIVHWTAGQHRASDLDRQHYHLLIEGDGTVVRGVPTIDLNQSPARAGYAAHTLNCNSGSIGVSLCCMAGAVESPFDAGPQPMTRTQWDKAADVLAVLCARYGIEPTRQTLLSHAEVQDTLGIRQRGKWDISRLAFDPSTVGAHACGDRLRRETLARMQGG